MFSGKVPYISSTAHLCGIQKAGREVKGEERINVPFLLFYRRGKLRARSEKLGVLLPFPTY